MESWKPKGEFEAWHAEQVARLVDHGEPTAAKVWMDLKSFLESAWQASRQSLVIELPSNLDHTSVKHAIEACAEVIESVGLKVKS